VCYSGLIYYLSSQSTLPVPYVFNFQDKILHFIEYFILYLLFIKGTNFKKNIIVLFVVTFFAATDEIHQYFVEGRVMSIADWLADATGATVALLLVKQPFKFINYFKEL